MATDRKPRRADRPDMATLAKMAGGTAADACELAAGTGFLPAMAAELIALRREAAQLRKELRGLATAVDVYTGEIDRAMEGPATPARGHKVAAACNGLNLMNDAAKRFGLGVGADWRPIRRGK